MIQQGEQAAATPAASMNMKEKAVGQKDGVSQDVDKNFASEKEDRKQEALKLAQEFYLTLVQLKSVHAAHPDHADYEVKSSQLIKAIAEAKKSFNLTDEEIQVKGKEYQETKENKEIVESLRRVLEINRLLVEINSNEFRFSAASLVASRNGEDKSEWYSYQEKNKLQQERARLVHNLGSRLFKNKDFHKNLDFIADHGDRVIDELDFEDQI